MLPCATQCCHIRVCEVRQCTRFRQGNKVGSVLQVLLSTRGIIGNSFRIEGCKCPLPPMLTWDVYGLHEGRSDAHFKLCYTRPCTLPCQLGQPELTSSTAPLPWRYNSISRCSRALLLCCTTSDSSGRWLWHTKGLVEQCQRYFPHATALFPITELQRCAIPPPTVCVCACCPTSTRECVCERTG